MKTLKEAHEALKRHAGKDINSGEIEVNQATRIIASQCKWYVPGEWWHFDAGTLAKALENYKLV